MNKIQIDIDKLIGEYYESDIHQYYSQKGERRASAAALSKLRMKAGLASKMAKASIKVGAHIKGGKASVRTGVQKRNGYKTISKLLEWQKDTGYSIGKLKKTETHKKNIGLSNTGKVRTSETKNQIRQTVNDFNASLTQEQRSDKYSNNARTKAATKRKIEILNSIKKEQFTSSILKDTCKKFDYDYKLMIKDNNLLEIIHRGTNQNNPSIYKKINYANIYN
jgi:hypothetical protein